MTKPINDFSDAKVGDKVTCFANGCGVIKEINGSSYPIICAFEREGEIEVDSYTLHGRLRSCNLEPSLFKGHVEFPDPIPVKRKVKKTNKRWVLVHYCTLSHSVKTSGLVYSLEEAQKSRKGDEVIQEIEISIEVEE